MPDVGDSNKLSRKHALSIFLIGLSVSFLIGLLGYQRFGPLARVDHAFLDVFVKHYASEKPAQSTVVIDIDEVSLSAVGQWPWPRYRVAALIQRIANQKPAAIGLDVLFSEPDRSSLVNIQRTFKRDFGVDIAFSDVPGGLLDNDGYLGHAIAQAGVVASNYLYFDHVSQSDGLSKPGLSFSGRTDLLSLNVASGVLLNTREIASQTRSSGFVNNQPDDDGVLRRVPLLIKHDGVIHANLALATVMRSLGIVSGSIESNQSGLFIRIGNHDIPIDETGFATLRFNGKPQLYRSISAVDLLNGKFREADLKGKIVFIGSSAAGLNDFHNTALDLLFPGLKIQAAVAENIVSDDFVRTPSWAAGAIFVVCVLVGALMSAMFVAASGIYLAAIGTLLVIVTLFLLGVLPYARAGLFVSPGAPIAVAMTLFVLFFVTRFAIEKRRAHVWLKQLENARQVTIESMASVAETRDPETGAHIKRTQHYVKAIAEQLKRTGQYSNLLTKEYIHLLFISAPLHDIGKVGVPDHILLKPGKLTPEELVVMKQHAEFGRKIIFSTAQRIEGDNFLIIAGEIAATHHEKWDGTGYPRGLAGQDIPLSGRIMAAADIYDALISRRCYKDPFTHEWAATFMREASGKTFDPAVLDAFFGIEDTIKEIAARYRDEAELIPEPLATTQTFVENLASC